VPETLAPGSRELEFAFSTKLCLLAANRSGGKVIGHFPSGFFVEPKNQLFRPANRVFQLKNSLSRSAGLILGSENLIFQSAGLIFWSENLIFRPEGLIFRPKN